MGHREWDRDRERERKRAYRERKRAESSDEPLREEVVAGEGPEPSVDAMFQRGYAKLPFPDGGTSEDAVVWAEGVWRRLAEEMGAVRGGGRATDPKLGKPLSWDG